MTTAIRQRRGILIAGLAALALWSAGPRNAHGAGDDCAGLGGAVVSGECRITTAVTASNAAHGGPFAIAETLHITGTGSITVPPAAAGNALTLNIAGDLIIDTPTTTGRGRISGDVTPANGVGATISIVTSGDIILRGAGGTSGARISSDQLAGTCSGGRGGPISLNAAGDLTMQSGSTVSSTGPCGGGEIVMVGAGATSIGGRVFSEGTSTVGRGGPVTVKSACALTVTDTGQIVSRGKDPGADLVHVEGACGVVVNGLIASTGPGHAPSNRCNAPDRPGKPDGASACVEVWSGGALTINSVAPHNGEINADTAQSGGVSCCAWVDLIARDDVKITGDAAAPFSVHANQSLTNGSGGTVTVVSTEGNVSITGLAIQAGDAVAGGRGGKAVVQAAGSVTLNDAQIVLQGDAVSTGGFGWGGTVDARAFNGPLSWTNLTGGVASTGDVRPTGSQVPAPQRGTVTLSGCGSVTTTGTTFPTLGTATTPAPPTLACGGAPQTADYVILPECFCGLLNADAGVTLTTPTPTVTMGGPATYVVGMTAAGPDNSTNVKLSATLPSGLTWSKSGPDAQACTIAGRALTCLYGTVPAGTGKSVTLTATTSASSCGSIAATASVTSDADTNTANNSAGPVTITVGCPDVRVTMTTSTPTVTSGANASYTVTTTAGGTGSSTNVVLTDTLPGGLTWTVSPATGCAIASGVLTCNFGTMAQNTVKTVTLTAATNASACGTLSNSATVSAAADANPSNNSAGPVGIIVNCPDVGVSLSTTTPVVTAGSQASYAVSVTANGSASSTSVVLKDTLPPGLTWTVSPATGCSIAGGVLTCNFGTMTAGSTRSVTLTATTTVASCGTLSNSATVTAAQDTNAANNSAGPVTITVNCPDVGVAMTATTPVITAGETANYSITTTAGGTGGSTNVVLKDTLPPGLPWTVGGPDGGACSIASGVLTCNFGNLAPGDAKTVVISAPTTTALCPAGSISNSASVTAAVDANSANNNAGPTTITVRCPDVSVALSTSTPAVTAGGTASYGIMTTAGGTGGSTDVVLSDTLPGGLSWTVGGADAGACSIASGVLTCNFGAMTQGSTKNIVLSAVTGGANCGSISDSATVSAAVDANLSNNSSGPVGITITCPDISIAKTTSTPVVVAGMPVSYTIVVSAGGTGPSTSVVMTDPLPAGVAWTVGGANAGSCSPASPVAGGTTLTCNFGTMTAGTSRTVTLTGTSSAANCPSISNTASVTSAADVGAGNNSSGPIEITVNQSTATSTAFGESITLNVLPLVGTGVNLTNGPLPIATGSARPAYDATNSVATAGLSSILTGQVLGTGVIVTNASSNLLDGNDVAADATVNGLDLDVGLALLNLLRLNATVVQSTAAIAGPCGALTATGGTTIVGLTASVLGIGPLTIPLHPLPNTVLLDALGIKIVLNEQIASGGAAKKSLTVNAIHIYINNAHFGSGLLGGVVNGDIVIASSTAVHDCESGGQCACQLPPPVASSAFGESATLNLLPVAGDGLLIHSGGVPSVSGSAPPAYNKNASVTSAGLSTALTGSILQTGVVAVHAASNAAATSASSDATVNGLAVDVVGLLQALSLDATLVQSTADVSGECGALTATGTTTLTSAVANVLGIGSIAIDAHPLPNTVLLNVPALGIKIVLNEQITTGDAVKGLTLTVNAIHVYLTNVNLAGIGVLSGDLIVAQSKAARSCGATCQ